MPNLIVASPKQDQVVATPTSVTGAVWEANSELALDSVTVSVDGVLVGDALLTPIPHTNPVRYIFSEGNVSIPVDNAGHEITVTASGDDGTRTVNVQVFAKPGPSLTIGFDVAPNGVPLADGADVGSTYAPEGVMFSFETFNSPGPSIYARAASGDPAALSPPNVVSVFPAGKGSAEFNDRAGTVVATFTNPVSSVTINAAPTQSPTIQPYSAAQIFLEAYDAAGRLLASVFYPATTDPRWGQWLPLTVTSSSANIKQVKFGDRDTGPPRFYACSFDNLTFK